MKKTLKKISIVLFTSILFYACDSKKAAPIFMDSNGRMNHLLLVIDDKEWNSEIKEKLKEIITTPVLAMPQLENQFDVSKVPFSAFNKTFRTSRNILIVEIDTVNNYEAKKNVYAKPQQIIRVSGPSPEEIVKTLDLYRHTLSATFKKSDIEAIQLKNKKSLLSNSTFKTFKELGIEMDIPRRFRLVDDTGNFLWLRDPLAGGIAKGDGTSNILVYSVPIPKDKSQLVETISKMRDTIGKKYIPGSKENMYMVTEKAFTPRVFQIELDGKLTYQTHGKWDLLNDFMAGPFLNFALEDVKNNRWIVVEGFVYAPSVEKRDYMFDLEAVLKTIKIN